MPSEQVEKGLIMSGVPDERLPDTGLDERRFCLTRNLGGPADAGGACGALVSRVEQRTPHMPGDDTADDEVSA